MVGGSAGGGWMYPRSHSQPAGPFDDCMSNAVSHAEKEAEDIYGEGPGEALENEGPRCALELRFVLMSEHPFWCKTFIFEPVRAYGL